MATGTFTHSLAHENLNNAHKNVKKSPNIFKPSTHYVVIAQGKTAKVWPSIPCTLLGCVRFA